MNKENTTKFVYDLQIMEASRLNDSQQENAMKTGLIIFNIYRIYKYVNASINAESETNHKSITTLFL